MQERPDLGVAKVAIVSGVPRSGTSLVCQMLRAGGLECSADDRPADEHNERGYFEDKRALSLPLDWEWLRECRGQFVKVTANLLADLPGPESGLYFEVVWVERDLCCVLESQMNMIEAQGKTPTLGGPLGLRVLRHLRDGAKLWLDSAHNVRWRSVQYEQILERPSKVALHLSAFFGGTLDHRAMTGVVDPNLCHHAP